MTVCGEKVAKQYARMRLLLSGGSAKVARAAAPGKFTISSGKGSILVDADVLRALAACGAVKRSRDRISLAGGVATPGRPDRVETGDRTGRRDTQATVIESDGIATQVEINLSESPLGQLMRLKGKDGQAFLTQFEFEAGERLRGDYTRGCIMPRLGANWEAGVSSGRRGDGLADLTDASLAARQRVDRALAAVGPELSGLLVDVCCFLKGLETVERERSWPVRSAKIILKAALCALSRHYRPAAAPKSAHALHWGAGDYRPSLR